MFLKKLGQAVLVNIVVGAITAVSMIAIDNLERGKDIFGRDPDPRKTRMNYKGDIYLGTDDYTIV